MLILEVGYWILDIGVMSMRVMDHLQSRLHQGVKLWTRNLKICIYNFVTVDWWLQWWGDDYTDDWWCWTVKHLKVVPQRVVALNHETTKSFVIALNIYCHRQFWYHHITMFLLFQLKSLKKTHLHWSPFPKLRQPLLSLVSQSQRACLDFALLVWI